MYSIKNRYSFSDLQKLSFKQFIKLVIPLDDGKYNLNVKTNTRLNIQYLQKKQLSR